MHNIITKTSVIILVVVGTISCTTSPVQLSNTGAVSIDTTPAPQSPALIAQGIRTFQQYKRTKPIVRNAQVTRVGNRVKQVIPLRNAQWEFVTFNNRTPNAFALPGGKVGVHTGILPIAKSDAGLATIISHEIAHVALNHHQKKKNRSTLLGIGSSILNSTLGGNYTQQINTIGALAINLPNSRSAEIEADQVGMIYMARAGYDPSEAIRFWERFAAYKKQIGQSQNAFFSTHPLDATRIAKLKSVLPLALKEYNRAR